MPRQYSTNKYSRILILSAVVLLAAVMIELIIFTVNKFKDTNDYPSPEFFVSDFSMYELVQTTGTDSFYFFETLANDAYFELNNLDGIAARTIDIYMSREPDDITEMVIRYSGVSDGIAGTFTAGIKKIDDRLYRASAIFDSIDSLRIYMSEKSHVIVGFSGIKFNVITPAQPGFSLYRLFLWAPLTASIYCLIRLFLTLLKGKKRLSCWVTVYFFLCSAAALFAFICVRVFSFAAKTGDVLIPLLLAGFSVFYLFVYLVSKRVNTLRFKALFMFLASGLIFTFATAPLQVPDEGIHFARSYAIASGSFVFDGNYNYPDDVNLLYDVFTENLKMYETQQGKPSAKSSMFEYFDRLGEPFEKEKKAYSNSLLIIPYIPAAFGIFIMKLLSAGALPAFYLGRLMNVLMVAFASFYALKRAARFQTPLLSVIFFPMTVFLAASFSYDAMLLAALIMFFGLISSENISVGDFVIILIAFSIIIMIKPLYLPLSLMLFTIPKKCISFKIKPVVLFTMAVFSGLLLWQISLFYAGFFSRDVLPSKILPGVDKAAQIKYILKNPLRFLVVSVVDGFRKSFYIGEYGLFGHLDLVAPLTTILSPVIMIICPVISADEEKNISRKTRRYLCFLSITLFLAISAGFYVADSGLGGSTILGIQARYFIPGFFLTTALTGYVSSQYLRPKTNTVINRNLTLWLYFSSSLLASLEVFAGYYL